jgi:hypothetical protein
MATRSRIGIVNDNGTVTSIYCHYDGYPDHNGAILVEHYNTESKIRELMTLGDISILGEVIGVKCDFDTFRSRNRNQCLAYGRDRGETNIDAVTHSSIAEFLAEGEEYNYLWRDNQWNCMDWNNQVHDLYTEAA